MATTISSNNSSSSTGANNETLAAAATKSVAGEQPKRPYYGKCQYKTGKCFNERTLKRNGDAHSLCEEHRIKQNLIQRRSDRKYQTVHAIRRRERSQRRAVLKKQVSMAVAQQLFYEHQQQKSLGGLPLHVLANGLAPAVSPRNQQALVAAGSIANPSTLVPPIQIPSSSAPNMPFMDAHSARHVTSAPASVLLPFPMTRAAPVDNRNASFLDTSAPFIKLEHPQQQQHRAEAVGCKPGDESSPTGIDDFTPDSFLNISAEHAASNGARRCGGGVNLNVDRAQAVEDDGDVLDLSDDFAPIVSCRDERELWTDEDIEFLQTLLLP